MFLKAGIEYKGRNQFNETILFVSACGNNSTLTEILIEGGCDLNECTRSWTALHVAAARNHDEVLRVLIKHGCDLNIRDRDGKNSRHFSPFSSLFFFHRF
jgi:ankyrin repeat protein